MKNRLFKRLSAFAAGTAVALTGALAAMPAAQADDPAPAPGKNFAFSQVGGHAHIDRIWSDDHGVFAGTNPEGENVAGFAFGNQPGIRIHVDTNIALNNLSAVQPGDTITIPVTTLDPTYTWISASASLSANLKLVDPDGETVFTVGLGDLKVPGSTGNGRIPQDIVLIAGDAVSQYSQFSFKLDYMLNGLTRLNPNSIWVGSSECVYAPLDVTQWPLTIGDSTFTLNARRVCLSGSAPMTQQRAGVAYLWQEASGAYLLGDEVRASGLINQVLDGTLNHDSAEMKANTVVYREYSSDSAFSIVDNMYFEGTDCAVDESNPPRCTNTLTAHTGGLGLLTWEKFAANYDDPAQAAADWQVLQKTVSDNKLTMTHVNISNPSAVASADDVNTRLNPGEYAIFQKDANTWVVAINYGPLGSDAINGYPDDYDYWRTVSSEGYSQGREAAQAHADYLHDNGYSRPMYRFFYHLVFDNVSEDGSYEIFTEAQVGGQTITHTVGRATAGSEGQAEEVTVAMSRLSYNANAADATGTVPRTALMGGGSVLTVPGAGTLARDGYVFGGWNTQANGKGTLYAAGSELTMGKTDMTLYAQWVKKSILDADGNLLPVESTDKETGEDTTNTPRDPGAEVVVPDELKCSDTKTTECVVVNDDGTVTIKEDEDGKKPGTVITETEDTDGDGDIDKETIVDIVYPDTISDKIKDEDGNPVPATDQDGNDISDKPVDKDATIDVDPSAQCKSDKDKGCAVVYPDGTVTIRDDENGNPPGGVVVTAEDTDGDGDIDKITITEVTPAGSGDLVEIYRMYDGVEHLYVNNATERDALKARGWKYEGVAFYTPKTSSTAVHRLFQKATGDHHYTSDPTEIATLTSKHGWTDEGVLFYGDDAKRVELKRLFMAGLGKGEHLHTADPNELKALTEKHGWELEGISFYVAKYGS